MRTIVLTTALVLVSIAACETSQADNMSGEDLKALLSDGLTMKLGGPGEGYSGEVKLDPNGKGSGSAVLDNGKTLDITGIWEIVGDQFCREWRFDDFKRTCETWRKTGPRRVDVLVDGKKVGVNSW